eukprot:11019523-Prorocentrum_lima.AAC.1
MTSSLVGSEMCIRDRFFTILRARRADFKRFIRVYSLRDRAWHWQGSQAVSYTHLTLPTICSV